MLFKSVDIKFRNKYKLLIGEDGEAVTTSDGVAGVNLPAESNQRMINDNTERVCVWDSALWKVLRSVPKDCCISNRCVKVLCVFLCWQEVFIIACPNKSFYAQDRYYLSLHYHYEHLVVSYSSDAGKQEICFEWRAAETVLHITWSTSDNANVTTHYTRQVLSSAVRELLWVQFVMFRRA
jgi:hypothetical protein